MRVYNAQITRVVDVEPDSENGIEGRKQIFVRLVEGWDNGDREYPAYPPNFMPNNTAGSGVWTWPSPGQECVVAITNTSDTVYILSYILYPGTDYFGNYINAETGDPGSVILKIGGYEDTKLSMSPGGKIELGSNSFSRLLIDGTNKSMELQALPMRIDFAGGVLAFNYDKENVGIPEVTSNTLGFCRTYEEPLYSDLEQYNAETPVRSVPTIKYVDKCVIRAGYIPDYKNPDEVTNHVFQLDTRQSIGDDSLVKDAITELKLGYQPTGDMFSWKSKKNAIIGGVVDVSTALFRYGALKTGVMSGEVLRLQLYDGISDKPLGNGYYNPLGEGLGWEIDNKPRQSYVFSIGTIDDKSLIREKYHNEQANYSYVFGGDVISKETLVSNGMTKYETLDNKSFLVSTNTAITSNFLSMSEKNVLLHHYVPNIADLKLELHDEYVSLNRLALDGREQEKVYLADNQVLISFLSKELTDYIDITEDSLEFMNRSGSNVLINTNDITMRSAGHALNNVLINEDKLLLVHGNSSISIKENEVKLLTAESSIIMTDSYIELVVDSDHRLKLDNTGLTLNGVGFAMETLIDWISTWSKTFGLGNMGSPVPLFPAAKADFETKAKTSYTSTIRGFRSDGR